MKVDGDKGLYSQVTVGDVSKVESNMPIRLEIASRILSGMVANSERYENQTVKDLLEQSCEMADALIHLHNQDIGEDDGSESSS